MSDYEDDFDDDLPPIAVSQSTGVKSELEMPPASEVVSRRAREEAVERALQELRDSYARAEPPAGRLDAAGQESETALSEAVTALRVSSSHERDDVVELSALAAHLPAEDAAFLETYVQALKETPQAAAAITEQVVSGIRLALARGWPRGRARGPGAPGAAAALLCAPRSLRAARALHTLLDRVASAEQVAALGAAAALALRAPARLLAAHDAARSGAGRGADALAARLLAAALDRLLADESAAGAGAALAARVRACWRRRGGGGGGGAALLRAAARALAAGAEPAPLLAALAAPPPRRPGRALEHRQVLANVSKLQLLFGTQSTEPGEPEEPGEVWPPALLHQDMSVCDDPQAMDRLQEDMEELKQEVIRDLQEEGSVNDQEEDVEEEKEEEGSPARKRLRRTPHEDVHMS